MIELNRSADEMRKENDENGIPNETSFVTSFETKILS